MTLGSSKTIGGIGALLLFIGFLPFAGLYSGLLGLIGLILVLIAMKGLLTSTMTKAYSVIFSTASSQPS